MSKDQHTKTGCLPRRRGVSPLLRAVSAGIAGLWLTGPFAHASSLVQHNQLTAPYPSSYSRQTLAKYVRKPAKPAPAAVAVAIASVAKEPAPPQKKSVMEIALQGRDDASVYERIKRTPTRPQSPALVEALLGAEDRTSNRARVRVGYGKTLTDNSNTVGMKNGTKLEEPGCLYVKTSLNF